MEKLGSGRAIAEAKLEITHGMSGGTLFIEANDPYLPSLAPAGAVTVSATHVGAMCRATHTVCDEYGVTFDYIGPGGVYRDLRIPSLGLHTLSCALFAIAIAEACGMKEEPIRAGLLRYTPVPLRQNLLHFGKIGVLLDAYNACPASMRAACASMELIAHASGGKMIAVLGDMLELGGESDSNHRAIGEHFARRGLHALFLIGDYAPLYAAGAMEGGMKSSAIRMYPADTPPAVIALAVAELLAPHDVLLIKGSRKLHLEELIPPLEKALIS
jgi:UDP-N-acetylmuramoyl-tripeptide--D-alanyl-D-alanine ligase